MATMKALRAHQRGGPEALVYEDTAVPVPAPGEVLVAPHAAAITFAELTWDETWRHLPTTPSHEFSGVIAALGEGVTVFEPGAEVYGLVPFDRNGAAAEFVTVPQHALASRPMTVSHIEASAVPLAALTAWQALIDHAGLQAGDDVLIHGGAGGVGAYAVQIAAARAGHVTTTAFPADVAHAKSLGADRVIDVTAEKFDTQHEMFDVVLDTVGGDTLERSYAVVRPGGHLVTLQKPPSQERASELGITATFFVVEPTREELTAVADLVDRGELQITIANTFPLAQGRAAFESGLTLDRPPGKTVLVVR
jgi:NADPH:quinone reductase-like Zn-dependent oxidoreductase